MKRVAALLLLLASASWAKDKPIDWLQAPSDAKPFWGDTSYEVVTVALWLAELPTKTPKQKMFSQADFFEGQKLLGAGDLIILTFEYKMMAAKVGATFAFLLVKGRSQKYGDGWIVFVGPKEPLNIKSGDNVWAALKGLWAQGSWAIRSVVTSWTVKVNGGDANTFDGELISGNVELSTDGVGLDLKNKTSSPVSIIWDECSFVGNDGYSSSIIHVGTKFTDKNDSQKPTIIPPNAKLLDSVAPTTHVSWDAQAGKWARKSIFENERSGQVSVYLTLESDGKKVTVPLAIAYEVKQEPRTF